MRHVFCIIILLFLADEYGCTYLMEKMALRATEATPSKEMTKYLSIRFNE